MNYVLAVFRSRTQTQNFAFLMRERGMDCSVVQTPPEANVGCGISARFFSRDLYRAEGLAALDEALAAAHAALNNGELTQEQADAAAAALKVHPVP